MSHLAIPVAVVQKISDDFAQDIVVVATYSKLSNRVTVITYGRSPQDKLGAADLGEEMKSMFNYDPAKFHSHEDFRLVEAATYKTEIDALKKRIAELEHTHQQ